MIDFRIFIGHISFRQTITFQKGREPLNHPILTKDATLSFKDVGASTDLPRILEHARALASIADVPILVYVTCRGLTRKGEIEYFKHDPKELADLEVRRIKLGEFRSISSISDAFYNVRISGHPVLIKPDNGVFDTVTVLFGAVD